MDKKRVRELIRDIANMAELLQIDTNELDVDAPQSLANDFSSPLVIAEDLVEACNKLMEEADSA